MVLVIEDDLGICLALREYFCMLGLSAQFAQNAVGASMCRGPSVVLLDNVPDAAAIIKLFPAAKIVLMTARAHPEELCSELGLRFLLRKPFLLSELDAALAPESLPVVPHSVL